MLSIDSLLTTVAVALVQFLVYLAIRRVLDRVDKLEMKVGEYVEKQIANLQAGQSDDAKKRKTIYERCERIEQTFRRNDDCLRMHAEISRQQESFMGAVLRLERVGEQASQLVKRMDEIGNEQVSLGKDMASLSAKLEERTS